MEKEIVGLSEYLNKKADEVELDSLRKTPDGAFTVKPSSYVRVLFKLDALLALLDDKFQLEIEGNECTLVPKNEIKSTSSLN